MTEPANSDKPAASQPCCSRRRGRLMPMIMVALLGVGAGVFASKAMSHGAPWGFHHHHAGGFMRVGGMMGPLDPADVEDRAGRMARHLAVEIDASKEQTDKLAGIVKAAAKDMLPLREKIAEARKQGLELMGGASVDRMAMEKLRAEQMANIEAVSRRLTQALADAGEVMTPEQRKKLAERVQKMREQHGWWRRG